MALQGSGAISISQIRGEMINCGDSYSLRSLSSFAGFSTSDSMSEFFGYSNTVTIALMVQAAGGGGGGGWPGGGGGGGAGGQVHLSSYAVSRCSSFGVGVSGGGAFAGQRWVDDNDKGANGGDCNFGGISINGGGGGGSSYGDAKGVDLGIGENGGCGGGGGINGNQGNNGKQGLPSYPGGFGNPGGNANCQAGGGGGGGTGATGANTCLGDPIGGRGGDGRYVNDFGAYYGGGGGGGNWDWNWSAPGGAGGGGKGASSGGNNYDNVWQSSDPGGANTGGGGGGIAHVGAPGRNGSGGSGIVRVRYAGGQVCNGGSISSGGGYTYHTFNSSGTFST